MFGNNAFEIRDDSFGGKTTQRERGASYYYYCFWCEVGYYTVLYAEHDIVKRGIRLCVFFKLRVERCLRFKLRIECHNIGKSFTELAHSSKINH